MARRQPNLSVGRINDLLSQLCQPLLQQARQPKLNLAGCTSELVHGFTPIRWCCSISVSTSAGVATQDGGVHKDRARSKSSL